MGTEYTIRNVDPAEVIDRVKRLPSYRGYDAAYQLHSIGDIPGSVYPQLTVWAGADHVIVTVYDGSGSAWRELVGLIDELRKTSPSLRIESTDDGEDRSSDFRAPP